MGAGTAAPNGESAVPGSANGEPPAEPSLPNVARSNNESSHAARNVAMCSAANKTNPPIAAATPSAHTSPLTADAKTSEPSAQSVVTPNSQRSEKRGINILPIVAQTNCLASDSAAGRVFGEGSDFLGMPRRLTVSGTKPFPSGRPIQRQGVTRQSDRPCRPGSGDCRGNGPRRSTDAASSEELRRSSHIITKLPRLTSWPRTIITMSMPKEKMRRLASSARWANRGLRD
jgi:hypothetical protein